MGFLYTVLGVQIGMFLVLGALFLAAGNWRLGIAQWLLAAVQLVIYGGGPHGGLSA